MQKGEESQYLTLKHKIWWGVMTSLLLRNIVKAQTVLHYNSAHYIFV